MRRLPELQGILVPLLTPILEDDTLDLDGFRKLAERMLQSPYVDGLFAIGASGEFMNFSFEERKLLMETLSRVATGGKVLCVNIGGLPEPETLELANLFRRHRFTVAAVTAPEPVTDTPEELLDAIAPVAATGIPFSVYWTPMIPKSKPSFRSVEALMRFPNFVGLKDSSRDMVNFTAIATAFGDEISVFQGVEMLHLASLAVGSAGMVGGGLNFYPGLAAGVTEHFRRGELDAARALQLKMNRAWDFLAATSAFRSVGKQFFRRQGTLDGIRCRCGGEISADAGMLDEMERIAVL